MKKVITADQIATRVRALGDEIREDAGDEEIVLLAVLKGTTIFLADLMREIEGDVRYELINVVRAVADTETAEALQINFMTNFFFEGKKTVLLKDVVSTGVIESYLMTQLNQKHPHEMKLAALLDRPELRTVPLEVDYPAFSVEEGTYVGYGLEKNRSYCNLKDIYRI
ncbi:MAG: phosphoribosyltransferase family protein [Thermoanaerobaculia bacterium]|nr:phosphoribosyltransferase family protein [Thermoanaerobaculia bacterium]